MGEVYCTGCSGVNEGLDLRRGVSEKSAGKMCGSEGSGANACTTQIENNDSKPRNYG